MKSDADDMLCVLCGSAGFIKYKNVKDVLFGVQGNWSLSGCKKCGMVWLYPKPNKDEIASFYQNYHTHDAYDEHAKLVRIFCRGVPAITLGYRKEISSYFELFWGFVFSLFGPYREGGKGTVLWLHARDQGRLLDFGCGSGILLRRLGSLGWETYGIEFDPKAATLAQEGVPSGRVFLGQIEDCNFEKNFFDVITMNHVIEHLSDPVSNLEKCKEFLKPGGKIVIATPNARSWGAHFFKINWRGWEPPRHLYIYTPESLSALIEKAGFGLERVFTACNATMLIWNESFKVKALNKGIKYSLTQRVINFFMKFIIWILEYIATRCGFNCGEVIQLEAKKPL